MTKSKTKVKSPVAASEPKTADAPTGAKFSPKTVASPARRKSLSPATSPVRKFSVAAVPVKATSLAADKAVPANGGGGAGAGAGGEAAAKVVAEKAQALDRAEMKAKEEKMVQAAEMERKEKAKIKAEAERKEKEILAKEEAAKAKAEAEAEAKVKAEAEAKAKSEAEAKAKAEAEAKAKAEAEAKAKVAATEKKTTTEKEQAKTPIVWRNTPDASVVEVAGEFDGWKTKHALSKGPDGVFQGEVPMNKGTWAYKFVVDGEWCYDFTAENKPDEAGNVNNIVTV